MPESRLVVRTPEALVVEARVESVVAEDATGRFGVRPGMEPLVAALVPSLLTYREGGKENWIAVGRGLIFVRRESVTVATRRAIPCSSLEVVEQEIELVAAADRSSDLAARGAFRTLYNRLQQSLLQDVRGS